MMPRNFCSRTASNAGDRFIMKKQLLTFVASTVFASGLFAETIQLPYQAPDNAGNQWIVYYQGQLQQQGNQPVFGQAAQITVNGQQPRQNNQQANYDDKAKELILVFNPTGSLKHTRRMKFDEESGIVRVLDVFENTADKEASLNLQFMTNTNYGVNAAQVIEDAKGKGQLGWAADTGSGRAAMSLWAGKGSKVQPTVRYSQGNNVVNASMRANVPGKGKATIVTWHGSFDNADAAATWVQQMRESKLLADLPAELKKSVVNVRGASGGSVGGADLLRGENTDIIELRGGDQIRGDLKVGSYKLNTAYGAIELPADKVASLLNVGDFRPRQLLVSAEGEIFGGELVEQNIPILLSSGQTTQVPLSQISRLGYRTGGVEQPEWTFEKPMLFLRSGERCVIEAPSAPVDFVTRYGQLTLKPEQISTIDIKTSGNAHEIYLIDGSKLSGIVLKPQIELKLTSATGDAKVPFPLAAIGRVQFKQLPEEIGAGVPTLGMQGGDIVCSRLEGQLELVTTFDTLKIDAAQVRTIARPDEGLPDVQITLFDQSTFRGTLATKMLSAKLVDGLSLAVPVAAIRDYDNPVPFPSESVVAKVRELIGQLNAEDWKQREAAELALINFGPGIVGVLQGSVDGQPPEVQQRLNAVIKRLKKDVPTASTRLTLPPALE